MGGVNKAATGQLRIINKEIPVVINKADTISFYFEVRQQTFEFLSWTVQDEVEQELGSDQRGERVSERYRI